MINNRNHAVRCLVKMRNTRIGCALVAFNGSERNDDMSDIHTLLAELKRPRLLIRAARLGLAQYNRTRDLRRLMRSARAVRIQNRVFGGLLMVVGAGLFFVKRGGQHA